ncbi:DUF1972 domain-containing protein (plasmid) [Lactiplantibacillus plantarum]|uniref:DUF1972 domain-containing protein n=1 Tax=Lactiplantibacillus plantarum TaxID=1590 RepID=UPI001AAF3BE3|nr:DUF1972 domain-containing protein [Lactiplantibacillus plantarum]QTF54857.1 DUF1972 domain-containing protein [Lactiplantibacillus plantarum]
MQKREVFIVGAKGIPARYGGFESFVDQLTARKQTNRIHYYVACRRDLSENKADLYEYNDAVDCKINPNAVRKKRSASFKMVFTTNPSFRS